MERKMYVVYDSKVNAYNRPFPQESHGAAIRSFTDAANQKDHPIADHPEDYTLFHIATYNEETGTYTNCKTPESLGVAIEYIKTAPVAPKLELSDLKEDKSVKVEDPTK